MSMIPDKSRARRILVVDDEPSMRKTITDILSAENYLVDMAATGEEAITRCAQESYDIVLMDVRMPGIGGIEAFRRMRSLHGKIRVILMSAFGLEDLIQAALDEGALAFLEKPLDLEKAIHLIGEVKDISVLVVEGEECTATILRHALRENGYRVTMTQSPQEALDLVEQIRFDLIFIDVALPAMNGLDLYLAIRKRTSTTVAVMITGINEEFEKLAQEAVHQNAYTIIKKPLVMGQILNLVEHITERRASGCLQKPDIR
ncbi:MAG: response regulator [Pirellulales bacterium]|nr:response regulator [Pirellulales bacterium]